MSAGVHSAAEPRTWTPEELAADRQVALNLFVDERSHASATYGEQQEQAVRALRALFVATDDLTTLGDGRAFAADRRLVTPARYLAGPPISADDLATISGIPKTRRLTEADARAIAAAIVRDLDLRRAPWLAETPVRPPVPAERDAAIAAAAALWAANATATIRRQDASGAQEGAVKALAASLGYEEVSIRPVESLQPGQFCAETKVGKDKCDVPIRLRSGELLFVECKVTNSEVNSIKRLRTCAQEFAAFRAWAAANGEACHTVAVIAGVFSLVELQTAPAKGVSIVWQHNLEPLAALLRTSSD